MSPQKGGWKEGGREEGDPFAELLDSKKAEEEVHDAKSESNYERKSKEREEDRERGRRHRSKEEEEDGRRRRGSKEIGDGEEEGGGGKHVHSKEKRRTEQAMSTLSGSAVSESIALIGMAQVRSNA